jgi:porphobilinogen synthase
MYYPVFRPRRLRQNETFRRLVRETRLQLDDLIQPLFVVHGRGVRQELSAMPGCYHLSVDEVAKEAKEVAALGIPGIILFGLAAAKDAVGSEAYADDGIIQQAIRAVKDTVSDLLVITDVCLCEYTSHGHCGVVERGQVKNDATLELLARIAVSHAEAGADVVAPSDMMDGRVAAIREALDEERSRSWPTRQSTPAPSMDLSARPPARPHSSAIDAPISWTRPMGMRRSGRSGSIWRKGRTS